MRFHFVKLALLLALIGLCPLGCISAKRTKYQSGPTAIEEKKKLSADEERILLERTNQLFAAGIAAEQRGDFQAAEQAYRSCLQYNQTKESDKYLGPPYHRLAVLAARKGKFQDSEEYFRNAQKLGAESPELACDYSQMLCDIHREHDAAVVLKNALITFPTNKKLMFYLGQTLAYQEHDIESLRYLKQSVGETQAYLELAAIFRTRGDVRGAEVLEDKGRLAMKNGRPPLDDLKKEINAEIAKSGSKGLDLHTYASKMSTQGSINQRYKKIISEDRDLALDPQTAKSENPVQPVNEGVEFGNYPPPPVLSKSAAPMVGSTPGIASSSQSKIVDFSSVFAVPLIPPYQPELAAKKNGQSSQSRIAAPAHANVSTAKAPAKNVHAQNHEVAKNKPKTKKPIAEPNENVKVQIATDITAADAKAADNKSAEEFDAPAPESAKVASREKYAGPAKKLHSVESVKPESDAPKEAKQLESSVDKSIDKPEVLPPEPSNAMLLELKSGSQTTPSTLSTETGENPTLPTLENESTKSNDANTLVENKSGEQSPIPALEKSEDQPINQPVETKLMDSFSPELPGTPILNDSTSNETYGPKKRIAVPSATPLKSPKPTISAMPNPAMPNPGTPESVVSSESVAAQNTSESQTHPIGKNQVVSYPTPQFGATLEPNASAGIAHSRYATIQSPQEPIQQPAVNQVDEQVQQSTIKPKADLITDSPIDLSTSNSTSENQTEAGNHSDEESRLTEDQESPILSMIPDNTSVSSNTGPSPNEQEITLYAFNEKPKSTKPSKPSLVIEETTQTKPVENAMLKSTRPNDANIFIGDAPKPQSPTRMNTISFVEEKTTVQQKPAAVSEPKPLPKGVKTSTKPVNRSGFVDDAKPNGDSRKSVIVVEPESNIFTTPSLNATKKTSSASFAE